MYNKELNFPVGGGMINSYTSPEVSVQDVRSEKGFALSGKSIDDWDYQSYDNWD